MRVGGQVLCQRIGAWWRGEDRDGPIPNDSPMNEFRESLVKKASMASRVETSLSTYSSLSMPSFVVRDVMQ